MASGLVSLLGRFRWRLFVRNRPAAIDERLKLKDIVFELPKKHPPLLVTQQDQLPLHFDLALNFTLEHHVEQVAFTIVVEHHGITGDHQGLHDLADLLNTGLIHHHIALIALLILTRSCIALLVALDHLILLIAAVLEDTSMNLVHPFLLLLQLLQLLGRLSLDEVEVLQEEHHEGDILLVPLLRRLLQDLEHALGQLVGLGVALLLLGRLTEDVAGSAVEVVLAADVARRTWTQGLP